MDEKIAKLPKWAQDHIEKLSGERNAAVHALNQFLDTQTEGPVSVTEMLCLGENPGPSLKRHYVQAKRLRFVWRGVRLDVFLVAENDNQRPGSIELSFGSADESDLISSVGVCPIGYNQMVLIKLENRK